MRRGAGHVYIDHRIEIDRYSILQAFCAERRQKEKA